MNALAYIHSPNQLPEAKPTFTLSIAPGHEEIWLAIRDLPKQFTAQALADASGSTLGKVEFYLAQLVRHGRVVLTGLATDKTRLYAASGLSGQPLVLDDTGQPSLDYKQRQAMWTAVRMNRQSVTVTSIWQTVREHVALTRRTVERFIQRLLAAGYLAALHGCARFGEPEYMLKPAMNTGPLCPRFCEASLVYDLNRRTFHGQGIAREVRI